MGFEDDLDKIVWTDSFEDALIEKMDGLRPEILKILDQLTPSEMEAFYLAVEGFHGLTPAQRKALERARKRLVPLMSQIDAPQPI